jgi:hypothetical protein
VSGRTCNLRACRVRATLTGIGAIVAFAVAGLLLWAGPAHSETDAQKAQRLEAELSALKAKVGPIADMDGVPLKELKAIARVLSPEVRGLTIDLSAKTGEFCLRDPEGGRFMVHFSEHPERTREDIIYFVAADSLAGAGLDPEKLPPLPALGQMTPRTWYYYDGKGVEPHHQGRLGQPYLVLALDVR